MAIISKFRSFMHDCSGGTLLEYALVGSLISVFIVGAVTDLGQNVKNSLFDEVGSGTAR